MSQTHTATWKNALLWILALVLMLSAAIYQRKTGPTKPFRSDVEFAGQAFTTKLIRTCNSDVDALVTLPELGEDVVAVLFFKRYKTDDPFTPAPLLPAGQWLAASVLSEDMAAKHAGSLVGILPKQPAAGKLEYYIELHQTGEQLRLPTAGADPLLIRFKDPVPIQVLLPHIFMMFFAVLIGMRAGLSALFTPALMHAQARTAFIGMSLGGMVLGPIVQKYAFGEYWTGWPYGKDLTDNKMLVMWLAWLAALLALQFIKSNHATWRRGTVLVAALVMSAVYLIPHSMRGSELDYSKLEGGIDPIEAIGTSED
jgi:hypothetical protein